MTQEKEEKPAVERKAPIFHGKPPFQIEPPPTARRKISEEPFDMDFTDILGPHV